MEVYRNWVIWYNGLTGTWQADRLGVSFTHKLQSGLCDLIDLYYMNLNFRYEG